MLLQLLHKCLLCHKCFNYIITTAVAHVSKIRHLVPVSRITGPAHAPSLHNDLHTCMCTHLYSLSHILIHVHVHTSLPSFKHTHTYLYTCMCPHLCPLSNIYTLTYTRACVRENRDVYTCMCVGRCEERGRALVQ